MSETLDLLVVIVNYRVADLTIECLKSLKSEFSTLSKTRVVVCENGSGDDSAQRIADAIEQEGIGNWVELVRLDANRGFAGGNNYVLRAELAKHDYKYVLLLNADTLVHEGCLRYCFDLMESNPDIGAMSCRLLNADGSSQKAAHSFPTPLRAMVQSMGLPWHFPRFFAWADSDGGGWDQNSVKRDVDWICGAFLWVRGDLMARIGVLDDDFGFYGEDIEYSHRVWKAGKRVHYDPGATITHLGGGSNDSKSWPDQVRHVHALRARYINQRKCYGHTAALLVRTVDTAMWGLRTFWFRLTSRREDPRYQNAAKTFSLLSRPLKVPASPTS
jgi:hypothetical protein